MRKCKSNCVNLHRKVALCAPEEGTLHIQMMYN